jgi:hypothetical protein
MTKIQDHNPNYNYEMIPSWLGGYPVPPPFFQHSPGVYCKHCGEIYALYSYSLFQPDGVDEQSKPYGDIISVSNVNR